MAVTKTRTPRKAHDVEREPNGRKRRGTRPGPGQPTKLTPKVAEKIIDAVKRGNRLDTAALYAGVSRESFFAWCRWGRAADARQPYRGFVLALDEALASWEAGKVEAISDAGDEAWQANAWLLERRLPDAYGRRTRVDVGNADGRPFQLQATPTIDPSRLSDDELEQLETLLLKARPDSLPQPSMPERLALPAAA